MLLTANDLALRSFDENEFLDSIWMELSSHVGKKIKTSLVIGKPDESEIVRLLEAVHYFKSVHGLSILLSMRDLETNEPVGLILPNVYRAKFDNAYDFTRTKSVKFHVYCYNNLLDRHRLDHRTGFKEMSEIESKLLGPDEVKYLTSNESISCRLFLYDE